MFHRSRSVRARVCVCVCARATCAQADGEQVDLFWARICAYGVYLCERDSSGWWKGEENKKVRYGWMWEGDQSKITLSPQSPSYNMNSLAKSPVFTPDWDKLFATTARLALQKSASDPKPVSTSSSRLGIRFQAKSKQVTSLEVITQVGYHAGQTNMAASWHPADRSKPATDREHSNTWIVWRLPSSRFLSP